MMYLIALILPPLALLMVGAWFQAILNLILFLFATIVFIFGIVLWFLHSISFPLWIICVAWAMIAVHNRRSDARMRTIARDTMRNDLS